MAAHPTAAVAVAVHAAVVVVVARAAAAVAGAAAVDVVERSREMNTIARIKLTTACAALATALSALLAVAPHAGATAAPAQKTFPTPDDAAAALVAAAKANDTKALLAVLGPAGKTVITSGDPVADETARARFAASYDEAHQIVAGNDNTMVLQTGKDQWPMPIPLVNTDQGWRFDTAAGKDEIVTRRIGRNELSTIQSCLAYADAQREYYDRNPAKTAPRSYAQHIASSKGKKDGLYWDTADGEPESPLGPEFATARAQGYSPGQGKPSPYHGYYFHVLTAQGPHAPGGAYDYVAHGKMIGGFALVAYPAEYGSSGIMTFLVNQQGAVYEKNLGPSSAKLAQAMKNFDPDETWTKISDDAGEKPPAPPA